METQEINKAEIKRRIQFLEEEQIKDFNPYRLLQITKLKQSLK